jgi:hypothetical protein
MLDKVTKVTALQNYNHTLPFSSRWQSKNLYSSWFQELVFSGLLNPEHTFYSDEVWLTLSGCVNKITYMGAQKILILFKKMPLHDLRVGVMSVVSVRRIIAPVFFSRNKFRMLCEIDSVSLFRSTD